MARKNKLGSSYLGLDLRNKEEEKALKDLVKNKDVTGKQFLRQLVRKAIKENEQHKKAG